MVARHMGSSLNYGLMILRTLNSGSFGIFLIKGNAGFISSTAGSHFLAPSIVRHPYNKGPKRGTLIQKTTHVPRLGFLSSTRQEN